MAKQDVAAMAYSARALVNEGDVELLFPYKIGSAIFRGNTLSFDWDDERLERHHESLTTTDGVHYSGTSVPMRGSKEGVSGRVEAVLYSNKNGHVLIGNWVYGDGSQEAIGVQFYEGKPVHEEGDDKVKRPNTAAKKSERKVRRK